MNVDTSDVGDDFEWTAPNFAGIGGEQARYILINFPTATRLTLTPQARTIEGTIYAPNADLIDVSSANTEGSIITRTFEHRGGEVHYFPFATTLTCGGVGPVGVSLEKSSSVAVINEVGQQVPYEFLVTNTGQLTLTSVAVTDDVLGSISCPREELTPGQSMTCTATYTVTQADLDAGEVTNTATAVGTSPGRAQVESEPSSVTIPTRTGTASIKVEKSASTKLVHHPGERVRYEFVVTNTGSVTLNGVSVTDTLAPPADPANLGPIVCGPDRTPNGQVTLAPGQSVTCTATYTVTEADVRHGSITNTATATGTPPSGAAPVSPESRLTIQVRGGLPVTGGSSVPSLFGMGTAALIAGSVLLLLVRRGRHEPADLGS